jgi:hypothetical protein
VQRYINLYQSSNMLGGGDLAPGRGFHGHYASFNLKDRPEMIHINLDKFDRIQEQLASKVRSAGVGASGAEPLRLVIPAGVPIELWDSGVAVPARAGDTLQTIATTYHVPLWSLTQINKVSETATLTEGQRIIIPRYVGQKLPTPGVAAAPSAAASPPASTASAPSPSPAPASSPPSAPAAPVAQ